MTGPSKPLTPTDRWICTTCGGRDLDVKAALEHMGGYHGGNTIRAEVLGVIFDLARETLTTRDGYEGRGWVMTPLPLEAEVRAALNKPKPEAV